MNRGIFDRVFDISSDAILITDAEGVVLELNPAARRLFLTPDAISVSDLVDDSLAAAQTLRIAASEGTSQGTHFFNGQRFRTEVIGLGTEPPTFHWLFRFESSQPERVDDAAERLLHEQAAAARIIASLGPKLGVDGIAATLTSELRELGSAAGAIFIDEPPDGWRDVAVWGFDSSLVPAIHDLLHEGPLFEKEEPGFRSLPHQFAQWEPPLIIDLCTPERVCGALILLARRGSPFSSEQRLFFRHLGRETGFAMENALLFGKLQRAHQRLQQTSQQLLLAEESERRRIALELHDQTGQILTALKITLDTISRSDSVHHSTHLANAHEMVNELMNQVRNLSLDLRPAMLDHYGLLPTLLWHFERYAAQTGIQPVFDHWNMEKLRLDIHIETAVFRIIQEALTNVARHASAKKVTVRAWATSEVICLQIEDQGVGFDARGTLHAKDRIGLGSITERAELLGGQLRIESEPGSGTMLMIEIPLRTSEQRIGSNE